MSWSVHTTGTSKGSRSTNLNVILPCKLCRLITDGERRERNRSTLASLIRFFHRVTTASSQRSRTSTRSAAVNTMLGHSDATQAPVAPSPWATTHSIRSVVRRSPSCSRRQAMAAPPYGTSNTIAARFMPTTPLAGRAMTSDVQRRRPSLTPP